MYKLIGISGLARHGKNTVGDYISAKYGHTQLAFAGPLKHYIYVLNPFVCVAEGLRVQDVVDLYGEEEAKLKFEELRRLYVIMGTDVGRDIDENLWLNIFKRNAAQHEKVVVTDVRFPNEALAIREMDGIVLNIYRPGTEKINNHVSEDGLPSELFDFQIENSGSIGYLQAEVDRILNQ